jgi:hypothetical protein
VVRDGVQPRRERPLPERGGARNQLALALGVAAQASGLGMSQPPLDMSQPPMPA